MAPKGSPTFRMGVLPLLVFGVLVIGGCGDANENKRRLSEVQYGESWPLSVDEGVVLCNKYSEVLFKANGRTYAVNGLAKGHAKNKGYAKIDEIWKSNSDITPVLSSGLSLCDK